jgi:hypothetical protein
LRFEDPALDYNPIAIEGTLVEIAGELRRIADWVLPQVEVDLGAGWKHPTTKARLAATTLDLRSWAFDEKPVDSYPPLGTLCSDCGLPQYDTPGGACCNNGHGGAPPKEG